MLREKYNFFLLNHKVIFFLKNILRKKYERLCIDSEALVCAMTEGKKSHSSSERLQHKTFTAFKQ